MKSGLPITRATQPLSAAQLARQEVERFFAAMLQDRHTIASDAELQRLDEAFEHVSHLLEAEWVREHGPITADNDLVRWFIGLDAGYLVGVQVGLRLRGGQ